MIYKPCLLAGQEKKEGRITELSVDPVVLERVSALKVCISALEVINQASYFLIYTTFFDTWLKGIL